MALISRIKGALTKKKEETVTTKELPAETKTGPTDVIVGQQAPPGMVFVNESGRTSNWVGVGGYLTTRPVGGGGSSPNQIIPGSVQGITPSQAYELEGGKSVPVSVPITTQKVSISPAVLQKVSEDRREYGKGTSISNVPTSKQVVTDEPFFPYVTRKTAKIKGYTQSGKPIYESGEPVAVTPYAEQYGLERERTATKEEADQLKGYTGLPNIRYGKEDIYSYGELIKQGDMAALVRRGGYEGGKFFTAAWKIPFQKFTGIKVNEGITAKSRTILGEAALYSFFAPAFKTTAQIETELYKPTQVKFTGVSQKETKNLVRTDVVFEAKKGATIVRGRATGVGGAKVVNIGEKEFYKVFGRTQGVGGERAFVIPKGLTIKNAQTFAAQETGLGRYVGKYFVSGTKGSIGVASKTKGFGFSYYTGSLSQVGRKGLTAVAGGTISPYGTAMYKGIIFPIKGAKTIFQIVPLSAKGGQVLINQLPKTISPTFSLPTSRVASLEITKSSVQSFATTVPWTFTPSVTPLTYGLAKLPGSKYSVIPATSLILKTESSLTPKFKLKPVSINVSANTTKLKERQQELQITKLVPITEQVTKQKQIPRLPQITPRIKLTEGFIPSNKKNYITPKSMKGSYIVSVRRFGVFKPIGKTTTLKQAFLLGRLKTWKTLGASFKIEGLNKMYKLPGYKTKKTKQGVLYIELPKYRLSTKTETKEIQLYKKLKGGRLF